MIKIVVTGDLICLDFQKALCLEVASNEVQGHAKQIIFYYTDNIIE